MTRVSAYQMACLSIGVIVGAYWFRVVRMARKARKKTGRAANFFPPEPLGRVLRVIWIPVIVVWIVHPFVTASGHARGSVLGPLYATAWVAFPAALAAGACLWASRRCWKIMGKNWRMGIDPAEQNALVLAGPYAYVRHPIYALSQAMMLATVLALPSPLMIAAGATHLLLLQWEARREEQHLTNIHGQQYADYCSAVGRFVPRFHRHFQ